MTRQAEHVASLRAKGWTTLSVLLSPDDRAKLDRLAEQHGGKTGAVRAMLAREKDV